MIKKLEKLLGEKGSMMVEALAMLGLISMVTPVLYKKAAERTTELQDINAASQIRTLSKAMDDMIKDHYNDFSNPDDTTTKLITFNNGTANFAGKTLDIISYLPTGFNIEQNKLFNKYQMRIIRTVSDSGITGSTDKHVSLTGLVVAPTLTDNQGNNFNTRAAKIASMIGANGGVAKLKDSNPQLNLDKDIISGVQGIWQLKPSDYGLSVPNNSIAATSLHAINADSGAGSSHVLFRDKSKGDRDYNTMSTTLFLGKQDMREVHRIIADSSKDDGKLIIGAVNSQNDDVDTTYDESALKEAKLFVKGLTNISKELSVGNNTTKDNAILFAGVDAANKNLAQFNTDTNTYFRLTGNEKIEAKTEGNISSEAKGGIILSTEAINDTNKAASGNIKLKGTNNLELSVKDKAKVNLTNAINIATTAGDIRLNAPDYELALSAAGITSRSTVTDLSATNLMRIRTDDNSSQIELQKKSAKLDATSVSISGDNVNVSGDENINLETTHNSEIHLNEYGTQISGDEIYLGSSNGSAEMEVSGDNVVASGKMIDFTAKEKTNSSYVRLDPNMAEMGSGNQKIQVNGKSNFVRFAGFNKDKPETSDKLGAVGVINGEAFMKSGMEEDRDGGATIYLSGNETTGDIVMNASSTITQKADTIQVSTSVDDLLYLTNDMVQVNGYIDNPSVLKMRSKGTVFYEGTAPTAMDSHDSVLTSIDKGILLNHKGMVTLPMAASLEGKPEKDTLGAGNGKQDVPGYIKADRLLGNVKYTNPLTDGYTSPNTTYDAYQVNPAYTSVMHDIKLTTRGGARLSDILPDFINKGIYVIDNTYKEDSTGWENYTVDTSNGTVSGHNGECTTNDHDCITTPWLGFVPAPQCPPGYVKVITISPIRWKMAEAYSIAVPPTSGSVSEQFRNYFIQHTNPATARFELENTVGSSGSHTHEVKQGMPLTFQTNTWLNTTISGVRNSSDVFLGWHAIMGFLYHGSEYKDYLQKVNSSKNYDGKIVWNIFPVYNEELAAVTNVYCYFERRTTSPSGDTGWAWDPKLVDNTYDQITSFRSGYEKGDTNYVKRLNDPALGYDDPW